MRHRITSGMATVIALGLAASATAGDKPGGASKSYNCEYDTQTCLDMMVDELESRGWVGIELDQDPESGTLTVRRVVAGSPAEEGGFQAGDVLLAAGGVRYAPENEDELKKLRLGMVPGAKVSYTVGRAGKEIDIDVVLAALPKDVLAQWVGMHMIEHAKRPAAKK